MKNKTVKYLSEEEAVDFLKGATIKDAYFYQAYFSDELEDILVLETNKGTIKLVFGVVMKLGD